VNGMEVEPPVVIGVVGTHSTGKSTFLARLAHDLRAQGVQVATVADLGEEAQRRGLPMLFNHTWASTLWFITRGISQELEAWPHADVVLVDRAAPDALGYYLAALEYRRKDPDATALAYLETLVRGHSRHYSLIFRTTLDPTIPIGSQKVRDGDREFRMLADRNVDRVMRELDIPHEVLRANNHDNALARAADFASGLLAFQ